MRRFVAIIVWGLSCAASFAAQPEVVLEGLDHPVGVAVKPDSGLPFVSESGKGRVLCAAESGVQTVITGLPTQLLNDVPSFDVSPLGLSFLAAGTLVVGTGDKPSGQDELLVFTLPAAESAPLEPTAASSRFFVTSSNRDQVGGNFTGVCCTPRAVWAVCQDSGAQGWLVRLGVQAKRTVSFERYVATSVATGVASPYAVESSPRGDVVVSQMGGLRGGRDSRVAFFGATGRQLLLDFSPGLYDVTGLAYASDGQLYATDLAWEKPEEGGLFQLVSQFEDGRLSVEARKIAALDRPTALAAGRDGVLFATVLGGGSAGPGRESGALVKISVAPK